MNACTPCLIVSAYGDDDGLYPGSVTALGGEQIAAIDDDVRHDMCDVCGQFSTVVTAVYI